jgi:mitochondrial import inner membrane translocase subunit TIM10
MSWFNNSGDDGNALAFAKIQAEVMADCFDRIIKTCNTKCIPKIYNNELAIGEIQCVDRCVGKYLEAQELVTKSVQEYEAKMMEQNKAGVNTGTPRLGGGPPRY